MKVVLLPCKLREDRLVPVKGAEPKLYEWAEFRALLQDHLPVREHRGPDAQERLRLLSRVVSQGYVGRVRDAKEPARVNLFLLSNQDHSGDLGGMIQRDPDFATRVVDAYRVEEVILDHVVRYEASSEKEPLQLAGRAASALPR